MRIVAGKYKRTPILTLEGDSTRPTRELVKEALFSSIDIDEDTLFLDLFSGSGSIGLEALSRGAKDVVFNDSNKEAVKIIKANLNKINENRVVYNLDWRQCLEQLDNSFDYIYLDPPYNFGKYEDCLNTIIKNNLLNDKGIIIVEVRKDVDLLDSYVGIKKYKEKKYGINKLLYYRGE